MRRRFLAICGTPDQVGDPRLARAFDRARFEAGLEPLLATEGLLVAATPGCPRHRLSGDRGIVLGQLFRGGECRPPGGTLDAAASAAIARRGPAHLLRNYWGNYLALVAEGPDGCGFVLREPSGTFPCYGLGGRGAATVLVSDAGLARCLGLLPGQVDWSVVLQGLQYPDLRLPRTALQDCWELLPGCAAELHGRPLAQAWRPSDYVGLGAPDGGADGAAAALRESVDRCVSALAATSGHILLELSGGLDSSILAACLANAGARFTCATMISGTRDGDEQEHARRVADHLGAPLHTFHAAPQDVDLSRSAPRSLPRPLPRALGRAGESALMSVADRVGADSFVNGGGGDNVFCYLGSAAPASDRLLTGGPGTRFWRAVADVAAVHQTTIWEAAAHALRCAQRQGSIWPADRRLLHPDARCELPEPHPWMVDARPLLPGKRRHIQSIIAIQDHIEGHARADQRPLLFPLLSQPVMELCLRIPSWEWNSQGRNRAVARDAFGEALPAATLRRQDKGGLGSVAGALLRRNRESVRQLVLDGQLAKRGIVDTTAAERILREDAPFQGAEFHRLLDMAQIEGWASNWS